ncbi:MAG TPA: RidA family protein [Burkholderiales bacterium]|nr:RidA family protein [Burkholderiales bacterium]
MSAPPEAWADGWGFVSGIGPVDFDNPAVALPESVEDQTRKVFANLEKLLQKRGLGRRHVVSVRIHLVEFKRFQKRMNRVYESFFSGTAQPARSFIGVAALTRGALVEMDFIVKESA